jgi:hypothetical protein
MRPTGSLIWLVKSKLGVLASDRKVAFRRPDPAIRRCRLSRLLAVGGVVLVVLPVLTLSVPTGVAAAYPISGTGIDQPLPICSGQDRAPWFTNSGNNLISPITTRRYSTLNMPEAPTITSAASTMGALGSPLAFLVTSSGYPDPIFTHTGTLPEGVSLVNIGRGTAVLLGVPCDTGTYVFTIAAQNSQGSFSQTFTLTVGPLVVGWGGDNHGQAQAPTAGVGLAYTQISAGFDFSLGLLTNGQVVGWGDNTAGETDVPPPPKRLSYIAVSAGGHAGLTTSSEANSFSLGLLSDGTVIGWGDDSLGQTSVPSTKFVSVAAGSAFGLGVTANGGIVGWGDDLEGVTNPPSPPPGLRYVSVAAGYDHALGLLSNGTVVGWGDDSYGETNTPPPPLGQVYTAIAAGNSFSLGLLSDGDVIGWGYSGDGSTTPPAPPPGTRYTAIAAGAYFALGLLSNGQIAAWGATYFNETSVPPATAGGKYTTISAGHATGLALIL